MNPGGQPRIHLYNSNLLFFRDNFDERNGNIEIPITCKAGKKPALEGSESMATTKPPLNILVLDYFMSLVNNRLG